MTERWRSPKENSRMCLLGQDDLLCVQADCCVLHKKPSSNDFYYHVLFSPLKKMATQRCTGLDSNLLGAFVLQKGNFPSIWGNKAPFKWHHFRSKGSIFCFYVEILYCTVRFVIQLKLVQAFSGFPLVMSDWDTEWATNHRIWISHAANHQRRFRVFGVFLLVVQGYLFYFILF